MLPLSGAYDNKFDAGLGILSSGGDFGRAICNAVNCGYDAYCTGASVGAFVGIISPDGIGKEWIESVGSDLILSPYIVGMHNVDNMEKFCLQIEETAREVIKYYGSKTEINFPDNIGAFGRISAPWKGSAEGISASLLDLRRDSTIALTPYTVNLKYPERTALSSGETQRFALSVTPCGFETESIAVNLRVPDGWSVFPERFERSFAGKSVEIEFDITAPVSNVKRYVNYLDIKIMSGNMPVFIKAALMQMMSGRDTSNGGCESFETENHFLPVSSGAHVLESKIKCSMTSDMVLVCDGTREMTVYIDGEFAGTCNGKSYVPASHRSENRAKINMTSGWHDIKLDVSDGDDGEVFIGFFKPYGNEWVDGIEFV